MSSKYIGYKNPANKFMGNKNLAKNNDELANKYMANKNLSK